MAAMKIFIIVLSKFVAVSYYFYTHLCTDIYKDIYTYFSDFSDTGMIQGVFYSGF